MLDFHPIADIFPLLEGDEFDSLCQDIRSQGLLEPIELFDGQILDGRNRYRACLAVGVEPRFVNWKGDNPLEFVLSKNLHRRHLSESQRALIAARLATLPKGLRHDRVDAQICASTTQPEAATMLNVSRRTVQHARFVLERGTPEQVRAVERGELPVSRAVRDIKRMENRQELERLAQQPVSPVRGVYDIIVVDPPWPITKIEMDIAPEQVGFDYPTMSVEDIAALSLPMADDCHVWLWTTQKYLPAAFDILRGWGLTYVCTFVWHKPGGIQPFGLPQYNCEFALYAHRGNPQFFDLKNFSTCFTAPRRRHSEKPSEFYAMVARVTAGRRLDMFARQKREGFDAWGNEAPNV